MINKNISHYRVLEKIGEGGMGVVYKAEDTKLDRLVALKFLPREMIKDSEAKERFFTEARSAAALNHSNVVTVHEINEHEEQVYIVMELVEGENLKQKISAGPIETDAVLKIAKQIAKGLEAAHKKEIIHRDIKSANIMITESGQVKILDFGLARLKNQPGLTKVGTTIGTTAYMSPEHTQGTNVDYRSDIWSLGVVLYELMTGKTPFIGDYEQAIIYSILNEDPESISVQRPDVPEELENIIFRSLAKDPDKRYENIEQLLIDLSNIENEDLYQSDYSKSNLKGSNEKKKHITAISVVIVSILIITLLIYFIFLKTSNNINPYKRKMLVVLPFANIGNEQKHEFFADGMTEEMITIIGNANPERLGVIARTSAMYFKGKDVSIENIGKKLSVGYILEGSVRRQGKQIRISAKLIQVKDHTLLWSKSFDSTMDDIFKLQSNVAKQITEALAVKLFQGSQLSNRATTKNTEAYEKYLTGRFFAHKGSEKSFRKAINYYKQAISIDPDFASCYAALSHAYSSWSTWNNVLPKFAYEKAKEAADMAFKLNPNLPDVHSALAAIAMYFEWNWEKAEKQFLIALELDPNYADAYHIYGHYLSFFDRHDESIKAFRKALTLDPLSSYHQNCFGSIYLNKEDIGLAERAIEKAQELDPESQLNFYLLGFLRERQKRLEEAINEWEKAVRQSNRLPLYLGALGYGYGKSGQTDEAYKILEELKLRSRDGYISAMDISKVYAGLGDADKAFASLEKAFNNREPWIFGLKADPGFDTIRNDPRFKDLLHRIRAKSRLKEKQ